MYKVSRSQTGATKFWRSIDGEPRSPFAHDPSREPDLAADFRERHAIGNHQDDARTNDVPVWQ